MKDTFISEKDTSGVVTEVLRDAPHRKVEGDVLDSQPILGARTKGLILRAALPRFPPVLQRMRKATGTLEGGVSAVDTRGRRRDFCSDLSGPSLHRRRISPHRGASTQGFVLTRTWRRRTRA